MCTLDSLSFYVGLPNQVDEENAGCTGNVEAVRCFVDVHEENPECFSSVECHDVSSLTRLGKRLHTDQIADVYRSPN